MKSKTNIKRWDAVAKRDALSWESRNDIVGQLIEPNTTVLDIGAGNMNLRKYLPPTCAYQPMDCVKGDEATIVVDFNSDVPIILDLSYDTVICSGVIEYLNNPKDFLMKVKNWSANAIITYAVATRGKAQREKNGWVNHLSEEELTNMLNEIGFKIIYKTSWKSQIILKVHIG